ncbi:hypothetical protein [Pantoea ananatis]|uniref:hypothetical protein n=1 Tax=Pantoea ananas TaxID=553 RepID=UPI0011B0C0A9|nr:hypothetical protein [Pantoea ananatis]
MKSRLSTVLLSSIFVSTAIAGEPASSKQLPTIENGFVGFLCGSELDGEPASPKLVNQAIEKVDVSTQNYSTYYYPNSTKRVALAYAYRDRNHGGDCLANVQEEYWKPKNQPK